MKKQGAVLRVHDTAEDFDESSNAAVIILSKETKALILKLNKIVKENQKIGESIYEITAFDNTPTFLGSSALAEEFSALDDAVQQRDKVFVSMKRAELLNEFDDTVRVETVILHVGATEFHWDGYYKHTAILVETEKLAIADLDKL